MNNSDLGKLQPVDIRQAWANEALNFTPWLADNLDALAEVLKIDLEWEGTEMPVSSTSYRVDIVARNPQDDSRILIENQLESADHRHLGQILTYMAGLEARVAVWVTPEFNDAHRSAIRWLNEHTDDKFSFFAVKVRVVKIGDSPPAPIFEVVESPNEWERQVHDAVQGAVSERGQFRLAFWAHFAQRIPDAPGLRAGYGGGWGGSNVWHRVEQADIVISQYLAQDHVGVYLTGNWREPIADADPRIAPYVAAIKNALGEGDDFSYGTNHRCVATLHIGDSRDRANWDRMVDWLDDRRRRYEEVLTADA